MIHNNKSNIVYYPSTPQTVYVQAVPVQTLQTIPLYTNNPPPYNPSYIQSMSNYNIPLNTTTATINNTTTISKPQPPRMWQTGMLDCFTDCGVCFYGCFCPCCLHGMNARKLYNSSCLSNCLLYLLCCGPVQHCQLRRDLRIRYNLQQSPCNDCCVAFCCGPCGMCQEAREIDYRKVANADGPVEVNMS